MKIFEASFRQQLPRVSAKDIFIDAKEINPVILMSFVRKGVFE